MNDQASDFSFFVNHNFIVEKLTLSRRFANFYDSVATKLPRGFEQ